jgi:hypothetical protein
MTARGAAQKATVEVERACATATNADEVFEKVDDVLRTAIGYDGASWFGTDPATLLSTTPARIDNIEAGHCDTFWQREFLVEDANLFRDLHRTGCSAATLRGATDDRPVRSARYREFLAPQGTTTSCARSSRSAATRGASPGSTGRRVVPLSPRPTARCSPVAPSPSPLLCAGTSQA